MNTYQPQTKSFKKGILSYITFLMTFIQLKYLTQPTVYTGMHQCNIYYRYAKLGSVLLIGFTKVFHRTPYKAMVHLF